MSQLSYDNQIEGREGLIACHPRDIVCYVNPNDKMYFGRMAVMDGEGKTKHPDAAGLKVLGVVASTHAMESKDDGDAASYAAKDPANILRKGRIWVKVEQDVVAGDPVFFRHAVGTGSDLGALRKDDDAATAEQLATACYLTDALAGELAVVELGTL